jgi:hypothetical protein
MMLLTGAGAVGNVGHVVGPPSPVAPLLLPEPLEPLLEPLPLLLLDVPPELELLPAPLSACMPEPEPELPPPLLDPDELADPEDEPPGGPPWSAEVPHAPASMDNAAIPRIARIDETVPPALVMA